jgi:hypothetical protein
MPQQEAFPGLTFVQVYQQSYVRLDERGHW